MARNARLHVMPVGDTHAFTPSRQRPVRVRTRSMRADSHFEPHSHAWAQLAYCATGILQVSAAQAAGHADEVTYIVPPSRAVWIAPGARHSVHVLETAEFRTLYIDASATPAGWHGCRMIVVSALLRESIHALDDMAPHASLPPGGAVFALGRPGGKTPAGPALSPSREQLLSGLVLDEITHADTQALGVPLPHPQSGDKRLRALCEAVLRAPSERATLAEWATDVGASERTVARLFRDELGTSYQQWRQQAILAHALPLLARGAPVSEVAAASGYASDSAFSAMFKAAMGQSPSHFQTKNKLQPL
ncbi:AraC family transcriptional regulator [Polaromonas sp.]|uniref:AraC family transcriptional regulator n=1 Tax=Polaromonas sp. TaxID=1869339 RepID=UPI002FC5ED54